MTDVGYNIPLDLINEILLRLPAKSVLRFRSVSKSWCSLISSQQFIDSFMALSLSRPRFALILINSDDDQAMFFFSAHRNFSFMSSSSILITEKKTLTMPKLKTRREYICNYSVRGFICCCLQDWFVVCNPSTGQIIRLAKMFNNNYYYCHMYLGYDPNKDEYKVLRLMSPKIGPCIEHSVLTLGSQGSSHSWRPIKADISNEDCYELGVHIDGVVYCEYMYEDEVVVTSFDVGSEQLSLITPPEDLTVDVGNYLTNYLGKLAIYCELGNEFILWILDDVKNQVWSKKTHVLPSFVTSSCSYFAGITMAGEIFYVPSFYSDSFEIVSYDVDKKIERLVRVEGLSGVNFYSKPILGKMTFCSLLCSYVDNITYFSGN